MHIIIKIDYMTFILYNIILLESNKYYIYFINY